MSEFTPLQGHDVARLLDYPGCIGAVRDAMIQFSTSDIAQPLREIYRVGDESVFAMMPGIFDPSIGFGTKVISVYDDPVLNKSIHSGVVVLFDRELGKVSHVADAHEVTKIRTGCASAVATDVLARQDAKTLLLIGSGTQAESHLLALAEVRSFSRVLIAGRNRARCEDFVARMSKATGLSIEIAQDVQSAAAEADVICTLTTSANPVLLHQWVKPGTHINVVGSSYDGPVEIDSALVKNSVFVVDSRDSALAAAAEFKRALQEGVVDENHIHAEIGEILIGKAPGRQNDAQITVYKSLGHISQDLAAVSYIKRRMEAENSQ